MSAVSATPYLDFGTFENGAVLYVLQQFQITFFVSLFDRGNAFEFSGKFGKPFFLRYFCEFGVHSRPFVMFSGGGCSKVVFQTADAVQRFEPQLGVLFFVKSGFLENSGYLFVSGFFRGGSKIIVFVPRLRFSGKCSP